MEKIELIEEDIDRREKKMKSRITTNVSYGSNGSNGSNGSYYIRASGGRRTCLDERNARRRENDGLDSGVSEQRHRLASLRRKLHQVGRRQAETTGPPTIRLDESREQFLVRRFGGVRVLCGGSGISESIVGGFADIA